MRRSLQTLSDRRPAPCVGRSHPCAAAIVLALLSLLLLSPSPGRASCQTAWCQQRYRLDDQQREAEDRALLAENPADVQAVRSLLGLLTTKSYRERAIADYRTTYTWEPPPSLDGLEERIAADRRTWTEVLARLEADDPEAWCNHARSLATPEERLGALRARVTQEPAAAPSEPADPAAEAELTACLARELDAQGRRDEAVDDLRAFLDRHPEPTAYRELRRLTDDATDRALLEEQASRRPDDFDSQTTLLRWLLRLQASDQDVDRGRLLATRLLETELTPAEHAQVCRALEHHLPDAYRRCLRQLLATPYPDADPETLRSIRDQAWQSLAFQAIHARDWPRFEWVLARMPEQGLPRLWNRAIDFTRGDFCPQFLAAYTRGIPRSTERAEDRDEERENWELAYALRDCGEEEQARELLQGAGLLRPDGSDPRRLDWIGRLRDHAPAHGGRAFPRRIDLASAARTADDEVIAALERWAAEAPEAFQPLLYLATIHEAAGDTDEAIASWQAALARRPDDLDLRVAFGALALRLERHDLVREVADRLLSDPAANPRQQAEADYLLGRVALREGRWDEASGRLARYFLRRLRFTRCARIEQCDRGLVTHLYETGDRERLAAYLEHAREAREAYASPLAGVDPGDDRPLHESLSPDQIERIDRARRRSPDQGRAPVAPPIVCTSPRLLDHLQERLDAHPDDPDLQRRLDEARSRRLCAPEELPDPETLFPDDELLGLSWRLRDVS